MLRSILRYKKYILYAEFHSQLSFITKSLFSFTIKSKRNLLSRGLKYQILSTNHIQCTIPKYVSPSKYLTKCKILESSFRQLNNYTQNINSNHYHEFSISSPATVSFWIQRAMFSSLMCLLARILPKPGNALMRATIL